MKVITNLMVILGLMAIPFTACNADAASGLFGVQMKLALKGKPQDQYFLGVMYEEGLGARANLESARMWYEKSAKQKYTLAIIKLKQLDNTKPTKTLGKEPDTLYETNPREKVKKRKVVRKKVSTSTKYSRQEMIAKRELKRKRKAWLRAMNKQSKYAEDAFE